MQQIVKKNETQQKTNEMWMFKMKHRGLMNKRLKFMKR